MKTIYLWVSGKGRTPFQYNELSELAAEFEARNINLGAGCELGDWCELGNGCELGNWVQAGRRVRYSEIAIYQRISPCSILLG
jgi:hypothetical protein